MAQNALELFHVGRVQEAAARCQDLLSTNPRDGFAADVLVQILTDSGQPDVALTVLATAIGHSPINAGLWQRKIVVAAQANKPELVLSAFRHTLVLEPADLDTLRLTRDFYDWSHDPVAAERFSSRLCHVDPGNAEAWFQAGNNWLSRNRNDLAFYFFRRAAILEPCYPQALMRLSFQLCIISRTAQPRRVTWRVSPIITPLDGKVWSRIANIEFAVYGNMTVVSQMLSVGPERLRRDPDVSRISEFLEFRSGSSDAARERMVEVYAGLHRSDQLMAKVDGTILEYIRLLIMAGEFAKAAARAALVREVSAEFEISWVVLMQVIRLAMSCGAPIDAARTDAEKLYISIPVWGKTHVSLWKSGGLANLAHPDAAKLFEGRSVIVQIFTTLEHQLAIKESPAYESLTKRAEIVFFDLAPLLVTGLRDKNYHAMAVSHWTSLMLGRRDRADVLIMVADYFFGQESLGNLGEIIASRSNDALYSIDLPIGERVWKILNDKSRFPGGPASAKARDLVELFHENVSERVTAYAVGWDIGSIPSDPSRLNVWHESGGIEIRTMQPQLLYASNSLLQELWVTGFTATDNGFADAALAALDGTKRMRILTDPNEFVCAAVELDETARIESGYIPKRIETDDPVSELQAQINRSQFQTGARGWALGKKLTIGAVADRSILDDVVAGFPKPPLDLGQEFARSVTIPAFKLSLPAGD